MAGIIKTVDALSTESMKNFNGLARASVKTINGQDASPPTYAKFDSVNKGTDIYLSGSDLIAGKGNSVWNFVRGTLGKSSGKPCWEFTFTAGTNLLVGFSVAGANLNYYLGSDSAGWGMYSSGGNIYHAGSTAYATSFFAGAILTCYMDIGAGTAGFKINGADYGNAVTGLSGTFYLAASIYAAIDSVTLNPGPSLTYPKTGYDAGWFS